MKTFGWIFVGLVAAVWTYVALTRDADDDLTMIAATIAFFSWALFAYLSLGITIYDSSGTAHTDRYPSMVAWGLMMAAPNLYVAIEGPLEIVKRRGRLREEVR